MQLRIDRTTAAATVLIGFTTSLVGVAAPARADSDKLLAVRSVGGIVVDGVHRRIFVSDPYLSKIVVTDYSGTVVAQKTGLPGVRGLALSADSGHLYAAVTGADAIVSFDTATGTVAEAGRYPTGEGTDPAYLAVAGGKVWFSYAGESADRGGTGDGTAKGNLGSLDLRGDEPAVALDQDRETDWQGAPKLAATPGAPGMLAAGDPATSASLVGIYDVAGGTAARKVVREPDNGHTRDLALSPDGSRLVMARVDGVHPILKTSNLTAAGSYPTEHYANAVAVAANGTVAAGSSASYDPDVHIFAAGSMSPIRNYDFPNTGSSSGSDLLADGALAWEPGGARLFAVTSNSGGVYSLRVLTDATTPTPDDRPAPILPVTSLGGFVVDGVHKKVFVSDPRTSKIIATDYSGKVLATRQGLPGVQGLALSADSQRLYGAVTGDDSIVAIATDTVTEVTRYGTGENTAPASVAVAAGKVWFGYGEESGTTGIGSLDLSGDKPTVALALDGGTTYRGAPQLTGSGNVLAAASYDRVAVYQLVTGTPVRSATATWSDSVSGLALSPDGTQLVTSSYSQHQLWKTADLSSLGGYALPNRGAYFSFARSGALAVGTDNWDSPAVFVFPPGSKTVVRTFTYPHTGHSTGPDKTARGGVAWEPDGTRLFTVSQNSEDVLSLRTFADPAKSVPVLTVDAPATAQRAKVLTVTGTLTATLPLPAGTPLSVTRTDVESPKGKSLGTRTLGAKNAFSFTDTPPAGGKVTYRVSYAGDATHLPAVGSDTVTVDRAATTLKITNGGKTYGYGKKVSFTATLGKTYQNRVVEIWADPYGADRPKTLVKRAKVNGKGALAGTLTLTRNTVVSVVYAGDSRTAPKTATATVYTRVKVSTSVARHYKTGKIGKTKYFYFRRTKNPVFTTTMTAAKGRSQVSELQVYYRGAWRPGGSGTFALDSRGRSVVELIGPHETGLRMRMRASYERGNSGDSLNATTRGAWQYFTFTR